MENLKSSKKKALHFCKACIFCSLKFTVFEPNYNGIGKNQSVKEGFSY